MCHCSKPGSSGQRRTRSCTRSWSRTRFSSVGEGAGAVEDFRVMFHRCGRRVPSAFAPRWSRLRGRAPSHQRRFYALYPMVRPTLLGQGRSSASEVADTRERPPVIDGSRLPQLAVFAASAVVKASVHIQPVRLGLARDAPPDARQCLPPRFGDRLAALLTGEEAVSPREPAPRPFDSAVYRRVDLILHGAILRPTDRHRRTIRRGRRVSRGRGSSA
jgi:hypothetical protein